MKFKIGSSHKINVLKNYYPNCPLPNRKFYLFVCYTKQKKIRKKIFYDNDC